MARPFLKGHIPWNKGIPRSIKHSEDTKRIMSLKRKGVKHNAEWNHKVSLAALGRKWTDEQKKKL
jgi:hypothetical protein